MTLTRNEIITALHGPDRFILAVVMDEETPAIPRCIRWPITEEADFGGISSNDDLREPLPRSIEPC